MHRGHNNYTLLSSVQYTPDGSWFILGSRYRWVEELKKCCHK